MELPTVEIERPVMPSPLPAAQQDLMNLFYGFWQGLSAQVRANNSALHQDCCDVFVAPSIPGMMRAPRQDEIARVMPPRVNAAVLLGNFNYQVGNGGFLQWADNGYASSLDALTTLYQGAADAGIEGADQVVALLREFAVRSADDAAPRGTLHELDDDGDPVEVDDDSFDSYGDLTVRYYAIPRPERTMQAMLDRFDEVVGGAFMAGAYRRAA